MNDGLHGRCPNGCGSTLFRGLGGYVTCSWCDCPEPDAASHLLANAQSVTAVLTAARKTSELHPVNRNGGVCPCELCVALREFDTQNRKVVNA